MKLKITLLVILLGALTVRGQNPCNKNYSIGADTSYFCGDDITLEATAGFSNYLWSIGETSATITVNNIGTYSCSSTELGPDLVVNGSFTDGISGFQSDYSIGTGGAYGPVSLEGTYTVNSEPMYAHNNFVPCYDHTVNTYAGKMLIVNGNTVPGSKVWKQTINVVPNTEYLFSTWATSVLAINPNPGELVFSINGVQIGNVFNLPEQSCDWREFNDSWNSGNATVAEIAIENQNIQSSGNDFALDDITFRPICNYTDEVKVLESDISISVIDEAVVCLGDELTVTANSSSTNINFMWYPELLTGATQIFTPLTSGYYYVQANEGTCLSNLDSIYVIVNPTCDIEVPNVFTPNNDGVNDFFSIDGVEGIESLECVILNRWGNVVFESNIPHFKWDGTDRNGNKVTDGTYFYKIIAKIINGEELEKSGFVQVFNN